MVSNGEIVDFISSRIGQDLSFLLSHGLISAEDEAVIRARLPTSVPAAQRGPRVPPISMPSGPQPQTPFNHGVAQWTYSRLVQPGSSTPTPIDPSSLKRAVPAPPSVPPRRPEFCRASWDYNVDLSEPNDLMFRKGDIIEITEDNIGSPSEPTSTGGLAFAEVVLDSSRAIMSIEYLSFNTTYIGSPYDPHLFSTAPDGGTPPPSQQGSSTLYEKSRFPNQMPGQMHPPPQQPQPGMQPGFAPPPDPNAGMNQMQQPQDPERKGKMGKLGSKVGNAMVTGFGFGAGAAVGGGIVDAIF
ncbi:hypothetical protein FRB99_001382 [Tulasnella sp. 403]|nr:hypothetical protein FRB99_001382 [Tulasnella sp. 403]